MRSEPRRADEKNDTELRPVSHAENDRGEVAPAVYTQDQEWNRKRRAICVKATKSMEVSDLAASAENGSLE